jgi:hypothetical protein
MPQLLADNFLKLSETRRDTLIKKGLVEMAEIRGGTFYGSVTVEVF